MKFRPHTKIKAPNGQGDPNQTDKNPLSAGVLGSYDFSADTSAEDEKARRPLAAAEVVVEEVEGNPGYYTSKFYLRPHYQLEGLSVSLRLVSKLPSEKG
jgi:predicted component of type VI protein secretion system